MRIVVVTLLLLAHGTLVHGQTAPKPAQAALLSFLIPGLGQRYVNDSHWGGSATFYILSETVYLAGMITSEWHRNQAEQSYRTWAASRAGAQVAGKDRLFFVTIGQYGSSEDFRRDHLRNRRWDQLNYVADPDFQWAWKSTVDLQEYRDLRSDAEMWSQRRTLFLAIMAGNRVLSAIQALRAARRKSTPVLSIAVTPSLVGTATVQIKFSL